MFSTSLLLFIFTILCAAASGRRVRSHYHNPLLAGRLQSEARVKTPGRKPRPSQCPLLLPENSRTVRVGHERIIGGRPLSDRDSMLPYVAMLYVDYMRAFQCTAIIVGPRLIFTAAHCLDGFDKRDLRLYFGSEKRDTPTGVSRAIKDMRMHPKFHFYDPSTIHYDVAFLTLYEDVPQTNKAMKVNANSSLPLPGSVVRNVGYGKQQYYNDSGLYETHYKGENDTIQRLDIPATNYSYCRRKWASSEFSEVLKIREKYHICAGYLNGGCSSCYGDSGGPIIQYDATGYPVLLGISSFAYHCGTKKVPTVYARVSPFLSHFFPTENIMVSHSTAAVMLPEERRADPHYLTESDVKASPPPFADDSASSEGKADSADDKDDSDASVLPSPASGITSDNGGATGSERTRSGLSKGAVIAIIVSCVALVVLTSIVLGVVILYIPRRNARITGGGAA